MCVYILVDTWSPFGMMCVYTRACVGLCVFVCSSMYVCLWYAFGHRSSPTLTLGNALFSHVFSSSVQQRIYVCTVRDSCVSEWGNANIIINSIFSQNAYAGHVLTTDFSHIPTNTYPLPFILLLYSISFLFLFFSLFTDTFFFSLPIPF